MDSSLLTQERCEDGRPFPGDSLRWAYIRRKTRSCFGPQNNCNGAKWGAPNRAERLIEAEAVRPKDPLQSQKSHSCKGKFETSVCKDPSLQGGWLTEDIRDVPMRGPRVRLGRPAWRARKKGENIAESMDEENNQMSEQRA